MILAAGLGTRLGEHTASRPKALLPLEGTTLLEQAVLKLVRHGIRDIIVNVHHYAAMVREYLDEKNGFGINLQVSGEEDKLLDTGGGIRKAAGFLAAAEHFFVYNVDVLSNIDLGRMLDQHLQTRALATLAVRNRQSSRFLLFDSTGHLRGWKNTATGESLGDQAAWTDCRPLAFSGIHLLSARVLDLLPEQDEPFSIIPVYTGLAGKHPVMAYVHDGDDWMDVGRVGQLDTAREWLRRNQEEKK